MSSSSGQPGSGKPMDWMYKGPAALVDRDDYLTGRQVDKALNILNEAEKGNSYSYLDEAQKDLTPVSIFATTRTEGPIDVIRKIKEDPLYQIQKKEEENLRQLLNNPVKMKQLRELAEKKKLEDNERESTGKSKAGEKRGYKKESSSSSSSDDSSSDDSSDEKDIDKLLAQKLLSMKEGKELLEGKKRKGEDDRRSSNKEREEEEDRRSSKKKREEEDDRKRSSYKREEGDDRKSSNYRREEEDDRRSSNSKRKYDRDQYDDRHGSSSRGRSDNYHPDRSHRDERDRLSSNRRDRDDPRDSKYSRPSSASYGSSSRKPEPEGKKVIDESEKERKLREMMENAKWRDAQRSQNVSKQREEMKREEERLNKAERDSDFIRRKKSKVDIETIQLKVLKYLEQVKHDMQVVATISEPLRKKYQAPVKTTAEIFGVSAATIKRLKKKAKASEEDKTSEENSSFKLLTLEVSRRGSSPTLTTFSDLSHPWIKTSLEDEEIEQVEPRIDVK